MKNVSVSVFLTNTEKNVLNMRIREETHLGPRHRGYMYGLTVNMEETL